MCINLYEGVESASTQNMKGYFLLIGILLEGACIEMKSICQFPMFDYFFFLLSLSLSITDYLAFMFLKGSLLLIFKISPFCKMPFLSLRLR